MNKSTNTVPNKIIIRRAFGLGGAGRLKGSPHPMHWIRPGKNFATRELNAIAERFIVDFLNTITKEKKK